MRRLRRSAGPWQACNREISSIAPGVANGVAPGVATSVCVSASAPRARNRATRRIPLAENNMTPASCLVADGHEEHRVLASRVWCEELSHVVVPEGQTGGAYAQGIRREVDLAGEDGRRQLGGPIAAVAKSGRDLCQDGHDVDVDRRVAAEVLVEREVVRGSAEIASDEQLEAIMVGMKDVS